jgi:hypothetical protein
MKRKPSKFYLTVLISVFVLVFPAFDYCSDLMDTDLFSTDLSFENLDQDDSSKGIHNSNPFLLSIFSISFLPQSNLSEKLSRCFYQLPSVDQETPVLRC